MENVATCSHIPAATAHVLVPKRARPGTVYGDHPASSSAGEGPGDRPEIYFCV